jgi:hypothetical protein
MSRRRRGFYPRCLWLGRSRASRIRCAPTGVGIALRGHPGLRWPCHRSTGATTGSQPGTVVRLLPPACPPMAISCPCACAMVRPQLLRMPASGFRCRRSGCARPRVC